MLHFSTNFRFKPIRFLKPYRFWSTTGNRNQRRGETGKGCKKVAFFLNLDFSTQWGLHIGADKVYI